MQGIRGLSPARKTTYSTYPPIGRALAAMHSRPDRRWTLEVLAREIGMSRSAFSSRFVSL